MSASEAAAEASASRARQDVDMDPEPEPEPEPPLRSWVALVSAPVILVDGDERAKAIPLGTDVLLDLHDPPRPSYLVLHPRIAGPDRGYFAHQSSVYIHAADRSGRLLFCVSDPGSNDPVSDIMYLCDSHSRTSRSLPAVPYSYLRIDEQPHRSIGLIADPARRGHYLVAQLYPRDSVLCGDRLLCCSTATLQWSLKPLISSPARMRNLCSETAVLAYAGHLWWLALAHGVFVCDPFVERPHLRFIPLPADCEMPEELFHRVLVPQRRHIAPSEGQLRYVEVRGLSYQVYVPPDVTPPPVNPTVWMWTLVDPGAAEPWRFEYDAPLAEVWAHDSYVAAGLPQGEVPHVALIDPDDHGVVYFFQGSKLFGLDVRARRVVSCEECSVRDDREITLRISRPIIEAWELSPPTPPPSHPPSPSSDDESRRSGEYSVSEKWKERRTIKYVESWLSQIELTSETDEGQSSSG